MTPLPVVVFGEALPRSLLHPPPRRRAAGSSSTSPFRLLDQEGGDVFPTVRVLNVEVLLFGAKIGIHRDLNRFEYDSFIRVLATLSSCDLQWYVDALSFPSLLDYSID